MGMVVDHVTEYVMWVDKIKGTIETVALSGDDRKQLFTVEDTRFFGITLYQVDWTFRVMLHFF